MQLIKNGKVIRTFATREEAVASELKPQPTSVGRPMVNIGNVAEVASDTGGVGLVDNFTVELSNACSAPQTFIIADPTGLVAIQAGGTFLEPTACSADGSVKGSGVAAMKAMFGFRALAVRGFNYSTSSNPLQFAEKLQLLNAEIKGSFQRDPVNVAINRRNNQFDDLLMTLDLVNPILLNPFRALALRVLGNETVSLEFSVFMVAN